jgi:hypothetical protein
MRQVKYYLIILPLIYFAVGAYFHQVNGVYSVRGADPEYIYFINGVNIANGNFRLGNIDHPGVPYDYVMAASLRITHMFRTSNGPFNQDVLANPDMYLKVANLMIIMLLVVIVFLSGYLTLKITKNLWFALIVQFSPFATDIIYGNIGRLPTENLIPVPVILLTVMLLRILEKQDDKTPVRDVMLLAAVSTLAVSLKLTLAPLLIIPFFLVRPFKHKLYFSIAVLVMFLVFAWPVTLQMKYFWNWMKSLILYSDNYGQGEKNILKVDEFWPNILSLYRENRLYFIFTFIMALSFISTFFARAEKAVLKNLRTVSLTTLVVVFIMVLALGKQYKTAYFIPALMLLPLIIIMTIRNLRLWYPEKYGRFITPAYILMVMILLFNSHKPVVKSLSIHFENQNEQRMKAPNFMKLIEKDAVKIVVPGFYGGPVPEFALMTSYQWGGKHKDRYRPVLAELYPNSYIFYPWDRTLNFWGDSLSVDGSKPVYVYFDRQSQREEFADSFAQFIPEDISWVQVFFNPDTEEIIYKLVKDLR